MNYAKPPIVEAIVELRFAGGAPWASSQAHLLADFSTTHPNARPLSDVPVSGDFGEGAVSTATGPRVTRWLLSDESNSKVVGIGPGVLAVHVVGAYPGWAVFSPLVDDAFSRYRSRAEPRALAHAGVRYIDRIELPPGADVAAYFEVLPRPLPSQPAGIGAFQVTTSTRDTSGVRSVLTLLSREPPPGGSRFVLYDLNLTHDFPPETPVTAWRDVVEKLHQRQKDIFEESITHATRKLFD